jgi:hypothetical protein
VRSCSGSISLQFLFLEAFEKKSLNEIFNFEAFEKNLSMKYFLKAQKFVNNLFKQAMAEIPRS